MDTVKEEERGSERGRERRTDGGQGEGVAALAADGAQERRRQRKRATQHAIRVGWDKPGKEGERRGKCRSCAWAQLALIAQCTPPTPTHTHTLYTSAPSLPTAYLLYRGFSANSSRSHNAYGTALLRPAKLTKNLVKPQTAAASSSPPPPSSATRTHNVMGGICIEWPW